MADVLGWAGLITASVMSERISIDVTALILVLQQIMNEPRATKYSILILANTDSTKIPMRSVLIVDHLTSRPFPRVSDSSLVEALYSICVINSREKMVWIVSRTDSISHWTITSIICIVIHFIFKDIVRSRSSLDHFCTIRAEKHQYV